MPLIIDDRLDICLAVDAAGLHIGDDELPVSVARQVLGPEKILGVTAKTVKRALEAETSGCRLLGGQELFSRHYQRKCTYHLDFNLETFAKWSPFQLVLIGGLTSENIDNLAATGIAGVAVVRDLMQAEDIEAKTQAFLTKLDDMIS